MSIRNGFLSNFQSGIRTASDTVTGGLIRDVVLTGTQQQAILGGSAYVIEGCIIRNAGGNGILVGEGSTVRHCTIRDLAGGTYAIRTGNQSRIEHCTVHNTNTGRGIDAGTANILTHCIVHDTGSPTAAIYTGPSANISHVTSRNNTTAYGIFTGENSILVDCIANGNSSAAAFSAGVRAGSGSTLTRVTAKNNLEPHSGTGGYETGGTRHYPRLPAASGPAGPRTVRR